MGIKNSKAIKILREKGIFKSLKYAYIKRSWKIMMQYYKILWICNKKIPNNYNGILLYNGVSGGQALSLFLERSADILTPNPWSPQYHKNISNYYGAQYYNAAQKTHSKLIIYGNPGHGCYTDKELSKFFSLTNARVPVIILLRDPISRIKGYVNHGVDWWEHRSNEFTLMHDPSKILNRVSYHGDKIETQRKFPSPESIKHFFTINDIFLCFSLVEKLPNASEIIYMDMSEITKDRVWHTMNDLSEKLSLPKPQLKDKPFFESTIWDSSSKMLPLTLYAHPKHIGRRLSPECSILYYQVYKRDHIIDEAGEGGIRLIISKDSNLNNKKSIFNDMKDSKDLLKDITQEILCDIAQSDIYIYIYILWRLCNITGQCKFAKCLQRVYEGIFTCIR